MDGMDRRNEPAHARSAPWSAAACCRLSARGLARAGRRETKTDEIGKIFVAGAVRKAARPRRRPPPEPCRAPKEVQHHGNAKPKNGPKGGGASAGGRGGKSGQRTACLRQHNKGRQECLPHTRCSRHSCLPKRKWKVEPGCRIPAQVYSRRCPVPSESRCGWPRIPAQVYSKARTKPLRVRCGWPRIPAQVYLKLCLQRFPLRCGWPRIPAQVY